MNFEHLREFIELSRQLNFTSTARTLHMTQPALSNHVHALEKETGVLLIERSSKDRARLTPAGQYFLDVARQMVDLYDEMLPKLRELEHEIKGKIVVRSPRNEYSQPLFDYIFEFRREHPQVDIVLYPWTDVDGLEDVENGIVDCAYIGYVDPENPSLEDFGVSLVPYTTTQVLLWMDRSHPLASASELAVSDIDGCDLLIPANKKHDSWLLCVESIIRHYGLSCRVNERYCDSLEDLVLTKAQPEDLMLCDERTLQSFVFKLREDRVARAFDPPIVLPVSLGYGSRGDNPALGPFVDFLASKGEEG